MFLGVRFVRGCRDRIVHPLHWNRSSMKRTTLGYAALVSAALVTVSGLTATAAPPAAADSSASPDRADTLSLAAAQAGTFSSALGLSSQEQLVVKDVVTDPDGTRHFRYDRTFDGLRVVGGDLVVHQTKAGSISSVARATDASLAVSTKPAIPAATAASSARV